MADTGYNSPGTVSSVQDGGNTNWSNQNNCKIQNDTYTDCNEGVLKTTWRLICSNFGFSIPAGATIDGIVMEKDNYFTGGSGEEGDVDIYLMKAGSEVGSNYTKGHSGWSTSDTDTYIVYGGASDKWGTTWTVSDINNSGFGVTIQCTSGVTVGAHFYLDHVRIKVYYTPAAASDISQVMTVDVGDIDEIMTVPIEDIDEVMTVANT